ncbi:MAG: sodium:calcium antiporter [Candidatus Portnoybacteria bacterium]
MIPLYIAIFVISFFILTLSSNWLVGSLTRVAKFLGWKEFVVAFFTMALASSVPNLSVGISAALHSVPSLAFGEIVGNNIIDLSLAVALAVIISRKGLALSSDTVQGSGIFTIFIAILPPLLVLDGVVSKGDGGLLILIFFIYIFWLFSRRERFTKVYDHVVRKISLGSFFKSFSIMILAIFLLVLAAEGIVRSATYFSNLFHFPIALIGILVVGMGNALPEIFFSIQAARRGEDGVVIGNLMGSVIITATLALGIVALIRPIEVEDISPFAVARFFLLISAIFFLLFLRTGRKIDKKEAWFLLFLYLAFVAAEICFF